MNFAWPRILWLLALPAALLAWDLLRRRVQGAQSRPNILKAEAGLRSLDFSGSPSAPSDGSGRGRPKFWLAAGLALGIVALARPQWGRIDEPVFDQSREIILAMDLSRSMLTQDVVPSRLERAKLLVASLLDRLAGERVGLVTFAGTAFLQSPLSADYEILREFLPSLGPDYLPEAGTDYGALIDTAAGAFTSGGPADRYLIILSDGGATDEDWRSHIPKLTERGIRVIGLGIGSEAGGLIPDGSGGFMKDDTGAVVMAKLEGDNLRELCGKTGGAYRDASEWVDLPALLKATVEAGRQGRFVERSAIRYVERFQWALAPALACLLFSFWREFPVRPKPRDMRPRRVSAAAAASALAALALAGSLAPAVRGAAETAAPPQGVLLGRIVGRLAAQDRSSALDWAEFARQTVTWGEDLQSGGRPVPPGPVTDALAAVENGAALDSRASDWPRLRSELEALLQKPEEKKQQQQQEQQQKNQQQQQSQRQQKEQKSQSQSQQRQDEQKQDPNKPQSGGSRQQQPAFGDRQPPAEQRPEDTQQVGGAPEHPRQDPAAADPELTVPMQKLDQIRNQDSPAQLFQMIENNEPKPPEKKGKQW